MSSELPKVRVIHSANRVYVDTRTIQDADYVPLYYILDFENEFQQLDLILTRSAFFIIGSHENADVIAKLFLKLMIWIAEYSQPGNSVASLQQGRVSIHSYGLSIIPFIYCRNVDIMLCKLRKLLGFNIDALHNFCQVENGGLLRITKTLDIDGTNISIGSAIRNILQILNPIMQNVSSVAKFSRPVVRLEGDWNSEVIGGDLAKICDFYLVGTDAAAKDEGHSDLKTNSGLSLIPFIEATKQTEFPTITKVNDLDCDSFYSQVEDYVTNPDQQCKLSVANVPQLEVAAAMIAFVHGGSPNKGGSKASA